MKISRFWRRGAMSASFVTQLSRDPGGNRLPRHHVSRPLSRSASHALGKIGATHRCWSVSQFQMLNFGWSAARILRLACLGNPTGSPLRCDRCAVQRQAGRRFICFAPHEIIILGELL